jgi:hypothetical protein
MACLESRSASLHRRPLSLLLAVCCLFLVLAVGCGRSGPEMVPVDGTITFGGGSWPKPGVLNFAVESPAPGMLDRPAMGLFDTDGKLTVTTFTKGDGLIPGKYSLAVECWEVRPDMMSPTPPKSYVPKRYSSAQTSGLTVVVEPGQKVVKLNLDVPKE